MGVGVIATSNKKPSDSFRQQMEMEEREGVHTGKYSSTAAIA